MKSTYDSMREQYKHKYGIPFRESSKSHRYRAATKRHWQIMPNKFRQRRSRIGISDTTWKRNKRFCGRIERKELSIEAESNTLLPHPQTEVYSTYSSDAVPIWQDDRPSISNMISPYNLMNPVCEILPYNSMPINSSTMSIHPIAEMTVGSRMDLTHIVNSTQVNPFDYMSTADSHTIRGLNIFNITKAENVASEQAKVVYHFTKSVLYPPNPKLPPPTRRQKPDDCKTVIVEGLPIYASEDILREIFEKCGEISIIGMSEDGFCCIRFADESSIESAMHFSGYWIKVDNKNDCGYTGRLHVDYAEARNENEYDIPKRTVEQQAHQDPVKQECLGVPTPPSIVHYSEKEAHSLNEKLKGDDTFQQAIHTLITWLERGHCNKKNANLFYSLIGCTSNHVTKLLSEKKGLEAEVKVSRMKLNNHMRNLLVTFDDIQKLFNAASLQKVRDHFTRPQRRKLDSHWDDINKAKKSHLEEVLTDRVEVEMDCSDDDGDKEDSATTDVIIEDSPQHEIKLLESKNYSLRQQLEASQKEVALIRLEGKREKEKLEQTIEALKQAFQGMSNRVKLLENREKKF